jgi:hypothetical protein
MARTLALEKMENAEFCHTFAEFWGGHHTGGVFIQHRS